MHYRIDLDPTHSVVRLTVTAKIMTLEMAQDSYRRISEVASTGGPYAAIYDLSAAKDTTIPVDVVRGYAHRSPAVPSRRPRVMVATAPAIFGFARICQMCGEAVGKKFEVVHTLEEAYEIVKARPEDFTQHLFPETMAA